MNRRSFLKILAGTAAASTTAYFLPPIGGWKSDVIASPHDGCSFECDGRHSYFQYSLRSWNERADAAMAQLNAYYERVLRDYAAADPSADEIRKNLGIAWSVPMPLKRNTRSDCAWYVPLRYEHGGSFHS